MLATVYELEQNPSRGVGGVAHTRFQVVRKYGWTEGRTDGWTEKCKSKCPDTQKVVPM